MKKIMSTVIALSMISSLLAGCGNAAAQPAASTAASSAAPAAAASAAPAAAATSAAAAATSAAGDSTKALSGSITLMASQNWIKDVDRELFQKF
jgi:cytoskeletal protein RodZ